MQCVHRVLYRALVIVIGTYFALVLCYFVKLWISGSSCFVNYM